MNISSESLKNKIKNVSAKIFILFKLIKPVIRIGNLFKISKNYKIDFPSIRIDKTRSFQILIYHRVNDYNDPIFTGISIRMFRDQMEILSKYFRILPLKELIERKKKNDIPENSISITFDDGYRDNYENAFPILRENRIPATIFLNTGPIESFVYLWHDIVFESFKNTKKDSVRIGQKDFKLCSLEKKIRALNAFRKNIRIYNPKKRDEIIQKLVIDLDVSLQSFKNSEKLSWEQIKEMAKNLIDFGAHTVNHPILTSLTIEEALKEILESKTCIEEKLKRSVVLFAYPNGTRFDYNDKIKALLRENGFIGAVTTIWGNNTIKTDYFELHRIQAWEKDAKLLAMKLSLYKYCIS